MPDPTTSPPATLVDDGCFAISHDPTRRAGSWVVTEHMHPGGGVFHHDYANAADALEFLLRNRGDHDAAYHSGDDDQCSPA